MAKIENGVPILRIEDPERRRRRVLRFGREPKQAPFGAFKT